MKTLIWCALQYVTDKYVHNKKSERVNLWDFSIIGGKLWEIPLSMSHKKVPHLLDFFAWGVVCFLCASTALQVILGAENLSKKSP